MNLRVNKKEKINSLKDCSIFCGIIDDIGLDSFIPIDKVNFTYLKFRCRYNGHRNARIYGCIIPDKNIESVKSKLSINPKEALTTLERLSFKFIDNF